MSFSIPTTAHLAISQNLVHSPPLTFCHDAESQYSSEWARTHPLCVQSGSFSMSLDLRKSTGTCKGLRKAQHYSYHLFKRTKKNIPQDWHFHRVSLLLCLIFISQLENTLRLQQQPSLAAVIDSTWYKGENTSISALLATSAQEKPKNQVSRILQVSVTNHSPSVFHLQSQLQFLVLSTSSTKPLVNMELRSLSCTCL